MEADKNKRFVVVGDIGIMGDELKKLLAEKGLTMDDVVVINKEDKKENFKEKLASLESFAITPHEILDLPIITPDYAGTIQKKHRHTPTNLRPKKKKRK